MIGSRRISTRRAIWLASTALAATLAGTAAQAQDATWSTSPGSNDYNTAGNWAPATVPTGTAFFGTSNTTALSFSLPNTTVGGWTFNAGASAYTFSSNHNLDFIGAGIVVNGGSATIIASGVNYNIAFSNSSSAGSATITLSGVNSSIAFSNGSSAGSATITAGSGIHFNHSSAGSARITANLADFGGNSSAGSATITARNFLFFDTSSASSATITNNGTLNFFDNSTAGSAAITNDNIGAFLSTDFSLSSGPLGNHKLSAGSIAGGGGFYLGANELTVGSNNLSTTVTGFIADGGNGGDTGASLIKTGTGTLTLSGNNSYTGATTVDAGTLAVNGTIAQSVQTSINSGATLSGVGTVGNTVINSGGTLAAGSGTAGASLTVSGSLALQSGAVYMVQINPTSSSFTHVTGAATLGGATVKASYANGSYVARQYTILTAGSLSGTFGSLVDTNLPTNFHTALSYDATHAYLNLILNFVPPGGGLNGNQNGVGNAIVGYFNTNGGIPLVYSGLTPAGLTQASGETATVSQQTTFNAMTQFMGMMTDPFTPGRGPGANAPAYAGDDVAANGYASSGKPRSQNEREAYAAVYSKAPLRSSYDPRWSVWAAGFGGSQTTDGNLAAGSNTSTSRIFGMAAGADYIFSPNTIAGFALAGGGTNFNVVNGGSGRSDLFQAGAFLRHTVGAAYVSAALAYGWQDITTDRTVTIAGVDRLRAEFNANAYSGRLEGGYRFVMPWIGGVGLTPYAAGQFTSFDLPAYAESVVSGANTFALAYGSKSVTDTRSELGVRADKSWAMPNAILTLRGRAAWAHDFNPDRAINSTFQALPGASFTVNGARQASESALTTASIEMKWMNGWSAAGTFEGEFSNVTRSYAGKGVVRYAW
jgi:autotransporter-associated beta strand protein